MNVVKDLQIVEPPFHLGERAQSPPGSGGARDLDARHLFLNDAGLGLHILFGREAEGSQTPLRIHGVLADGLEFPGAVASAGTAKDLLLGPDR